MFVTQGTRNEIRDLEESSRDGERHGNGVSHTHTRAHTVSKAERKDSRLREHVALYAESA